MTVTFEIPPHVEQRLLAEQRDIGAEAKESFLVDLYRRGQLTHFDLSKALGLDRFETEDVLHKHNVTEDLGTLQDYLDDIETLKQLRSRH